MAKNLNSSSMTFRITLLTASSAAVLLLGMSGNALADGGSDLHANFVNLAIANTVAYDSFNGAVTEQSATVNGKTLTVTFSGDLQSNMVDINNFTVQDGNNADFVINGAIDKNTLTLTLGTAVSSGDSVTVSYKPSGFYDLTDSNGNLIAAFSSLAVTNTTPSSSSGTNQSKPPAAPRSITVNGKTLTITFSGDLQSNAVNPNVFTVIAGNAPDAVTSDKVDGTVLTLTLKRPVSLGNAVTISYHPTSSNHLTGYGGVAIPGFSNQAVTNVTKSSRVTNSANSAKAVYNGTWLLVGKSPYLTGNDKHYADYSNKVSALTSEGRVLYAGTRDGVYSFSASAWRLIGSSRYLNTGSLIPFDNTLFATFAYKGVAYYANGKWYQAGASQDMNAGALVVSENKLYAGTDKGIYVLQHNGAWSSVGPSAHLTWAGMLAGINGQLYTAASQNDVGQVFGYHNGSWQAVGQLGSYFSPIDAHALVRYHNVLYAATDTGVYAHSAGSWSMATRGTWKDVGLDHWDVRTLIILNGTMFAATIHGVYAYVNGSWQQVGASFYQKTGYGAAADVSTLTVLHGVLYAGTAYGVYAYSNGAKH